MPDVTISRTPKTHPFYRITMDGEELQFNDGQSKMTLDAGKHRLTYKILGKPGLAFTIAATGASMVPVKRSIPEDGEAAGIRTVTVD